MIALVHKGARVGLAYVHRRDPRYRHLIRWRIGTNWDEITHWVRDDEVIMVWQSMPTQDMVDRVRIKKGL